MTELMRQAVITRLIICEAHDHLEEIPKWLEKAHKSQQKVVCMLRDFEKIIQEAEDLKDKVTVMESVLRRIKNALRELMV
jgi:hypothetical protein